MLVILVSLLTAVSLTHCQIPCFKENPNNSVVPYFCLENDICCDEGCCTKPYIIPKVSITLGINLFLFVFFLSLLIWCLDMTKRLCHNDINTISVNLAVLDRLDEIDADPPPVYSVAIHLPTNRIPTYEEATETSL
ncbi:uncharacterized protein LOC123009725 isoform X3 [Tribolium madens]|uniref:uncharacterized protein LOC123009725 isoform X3 n=1 Tax=Tribolium madens TaxID=41895 RepID=UPI001CF73037|nr:uncharacterized protein LOC123009725 isoform X3 [Tribolium madens]